MTDLSIEETGGPGKGARFEIHVPMDRAEVVIQRSISCPNFDDRPVPVQIL